LKPVLKRRHSRKGFSLLLLAILCAAGSAYARDSVGSPSALPVVLDQKQAARRLLVKPTPEYPPVAKVNYLQGEVRLKLTVDRAGRVTSAHAVQGTAVFAAASLKAVRDWVYRPLPTPQGDEGFIAFVRLKFALTSGPPDLPPRRAEQDFDRQIKPPVATPPHQDVQSGDLVHLRLLVNDQGKVVDVEMQSSDPSQSEVSPEALRGWTFRPAHWGNVPIASYVDVSVPLGTRAIARAGSAFGAR
jgi:TonB family protein